MIKAEGLFSNKEEKQIISAIKKAENNTSGEIRIHIDESSESDCLVRAKKAFIALKMDKTKYRNGVLFYISALEKEFAIYGDVGIDKSTSADFWEEVKDVVILHFKKNEFVMGLTKGIEMAGESLRKYFPFEDDDVDELPDEISYEGKTK